MTSVTSKPAAASRVAGMPLELLCKAKKRRIAGLDRPGNTALSLAWSAKGSYRQDNILRYHDRWLEPWTALPAKQQDWRILMLDVASSHCGPEVVSFAHARGYVVLYHYGGFTGVIQVNDTDLHAEFSNIYFGFGADRLPQPADDRPWEHQPLVAGRRGRRVFCVAVLRPPQRRSRFRTRRRAPALWHAPWYIDAHSCSSM